MKKEKVLKFLAYICLLIPGNMKSRKSWFLSCTSLFSLVALMFSIGSAVIEVYGYSDFTHVKQANDLSLKLKHIPSRPIAFCLKLEKLTQVPNDTWVDEATGDGNTSSQNRPRGQKHAKGPGLLEDIVNMAYRLLVFGINILVRIFVWISFPTMIDLLESVFTPQDSRSPAQNEFMIKLWRSSAQNWSGTEKVFLFITGVSQLLREVDMFVKFGTSIANTGLDLLDTKCILSQFLIEQGKTQFARELVMEVATFALIIVMKAFENALNSIAGQSEDEAEEETNSQSEIAPGQDSNPNLVFVKSQAMLLKAEMKRKAGKGRSNLILPNGMTSAYRHVSEIVSGYKDGNEDITNVVGLNFQTRTERQASRGYIEAKREDTVEQIYSRMNFIISMYFDLMATWERAGRLTGYITLLLFCVLTTTFCFNTYITLDNAMEFGLMSPFGILGITRGAVIVTKFICVCNSAQALQDMTPVLLDRILKLKLKLLSLPSECYKKRSGKHGIQEEFPRSMAPYECERCRGLGSFLSEMVSYIRGHPFELSALGYFTVSRSTLTTITGVIVTYLVVLIQFQSYSSS